MNASALSSRMASLISGGRKAESRRFYSVEVPAQGGGWVSVTVTEDPQAAVRSARELTTRYGKAQVVVKECP